MNKTKEALQQFSYVNFLDIICIQHSTNNQQLEFHIIYVTLHD